jgi:glycosyltransferase involved in cell wall biosynthesis
MTTKKLSAVLITYNEADNILKTLESLSWCDEIIVVDSYSTDKTWDICEEYGCKVYERKFDGFGGQKQFAVAQTKNDWVLNLDADEVLTPELINEIKEEMKNPAASGYMIPRRFVFMGKLFKYGKESRTSYLRLFDKTAGNFNDNKVHETVAIKGVIKKLKGSMLHYSYKNLSHYFDKFNKYTSAGAEAAVEKGKKKSSLLIVITMPLNFFKYYFIDLNVLNGFAGFCWSMLSTFYHFTKYLKTREHY